MTDVASIVGWLGAGILGLVVGAYLNHRLGRRRDRLRDVAQSDERVLTSVIDYADRFFEQIDLMTSVLMLPTTPPHVHQVISGVTYADPEAAAVVAEAELAAWELIHKAARAIGGLSPRRYDGVRDLAARLMAAVTGPRSSVHRL